MNILITHVYSTDNKGDAALLDVLVQEVQTQFKHSKITILNMDKIGDGELFAGVPMRHSFMYFINARRSNLVWWLIYGSVMLVYSLVVASLQHTLGWRLPIAKEWRELIELYANSDLVITVGGGYLRTKPGIGSIYDFFQLLHPITLARRLGRPTVLYSQSVGPVHRGLERMMLKHILNRDTLLVIAREDKSMRLLQDIGVKQVVRSVDAGFLLKTDSEVAKNTQLSVPKDRLILGVTARQWLNKTAQTAYETAMAQTLDYMVKTYNAYIVFIPQVTSEFHDDDDRITSRAIYEKMAQTQDATVLEQNYDHQQIKALYDQLDLLLGTRFHSVIFSLTSLVPAMAIEYEHKTSGIMNDLGLGEWVVKMEDVSFELLQPKMDALVAQRDAYQTHLKEVLPGYIHQAHDAIVKTAEAYDNRDGQ